MISVITHFPILRHFLLSCFVTLPATPQQHLYLGIPGLDYHDFADSATRVRVPLSSWYQYAWRVTNET